MQEVLKTESVPDEPSTGKIPISSHQSIIPHAGDLEISDEAKPVQRSRQMQFNFPDRQGMKGYNTTAAAGSKSLA